jgi:hypothetical protein
MSDTFMQLVAAAFIYIRLSLAAVLLTAVTFIFYGEMAKWRHIVFGSGFIITTSIPSLILLCNQ